MTFFSTSIRVINTICFCYFEKEKEDGIRNGNRINRWHPCTLFRILIVFVSMVESTWNNCKYSLLPQSLCFVLFLFPSPSPFPRYLSIPIPNRAHYLALYRSLFPLWHRPQQSNLRDYIIFLLHVITIMCCLYFDFIQVLCSIHHSDGLCACMYIHFPAFSLYFESVFCFYWIFGWFICFD